MHWVYPHNSISGAAPSVFPRDQCSPTTGPRAVCGPPQRFQWPAEAFRKNLQIWTWKACVVTFASLNCLRRIKYICTRTINTTFSMYHFVLFIYFTIKLEGRPAANPPQDTCLDNHCVYSVSRRSLPWRVHLAQWTLYSQKICLSIR